MATMAAIDQNGEVSVGAAFSKGFALLGRRPVEIILASMLLGALPWIALEVLSQHFLAQLAPGVWQRAAFALVAAVLVGVIGMTAALGLISRIAVTTADDRHEPFAASFDITLRCYPALLAMALVRDFATWLGMMLLIIPGMILSVMWAVATPGLVAERLGPIEALRRSAALTRGARWRVFGLALIMGIAEIGGSYLLERLLGNYYGGRVELDRTIAQGWPVSYMITMAAYHAAVIAISGSVFAALYVQLRDSTDGPQTDTLAEVFA